MDNPNITGKFVKKKLQKEEETVTSSETKVNCPCGKVQCNFVVRYKKVDNSPDFRYNENRQHFLQKGRNKDGSKDMRLNKNRKSEGLIPNSDDLEILSPKTTKDCSIYILDRLAEQEQTLLKRINNSSQNIVSEIEGVFHDQKKVRNEGLNLNNELNLSRWEVLLQYPEKNSKRLQQEFILLENRNQELVKKYSDLEDQLEKVKVSNVKDIKDFGEKFLERLTILEKEVNKLREEKKVAVGQIEGLEDQIQLKSLEFEKLRANSVDDKKKLEKNKEKLECSLELVKNLLSQKKQLKSKVDEAHIKLESMQISSKIESEKTKLSNKFDELENFLKQDSEDKCKKEKSKRTSKKSEGKKLNRQAN